MLIQIAATLIAISSSPLANFSALLPLGRRVSILRRSLIITIGGVGCVCCRSYQLPLLILTPLLQSTMLVRIALLIVGFNHRSGLLALGWTHAVTVTVYVFGADLGGEADTHLHHHLHLLIILIKVITNITRSQNLFCILMHYNWLVSVLRQLHRVPLYILYHVNLLAIELVCSGFVQLFYIYYRDFVWGCLLL